MNIKNTSIHHIAIIMDGNGRWAQRKGKNRILGHQEGLNTVKKIVKYAIKKKIKILTLYTFSTENWERPKLEVTELMNLFLLALKQEINNLNKYNIQLNVIGKLKDFNKSLQDYINKSKNKTINNNGLVLNIAANYGGKWDIIEAVKKIAYEIKQDILSISKIKEQIFSQYLSTSSLPPVDLIIRTGGERRMSNFLLWQTTYSELYFTDILWPDFREHHFQEAINYFLSRERRFGGIK